MGFFQALSAKLPALKTPIQLIGFVVLVVGFLITRATNPNATLAQVSVGAIGVVIVVFAQVFEKLATYPREKRAQVTIVLFSVFCALVAFLVTAAIVSTTISAKPPVATSEVSIGFGDAPLADLIAAVESRFDVTVAWAASCKDSHRKTVIHGGTQTGSDVRDLLQALQQRARGSLKYSVTQSGSRYEIDCR